jgi:CheY-like chemotaxis protein
VTPSRPARLALVDDNGDDLVLTRLAFRRAGLALDFESFTTGERFLEAMAARAADGGDPDDAALRPAATAAMPDLVLVDLNLPLLRGSDVIRGARAATWSGAMVLGVCSGSVDPADRALCAEAGAAFFLPKPVTAATLAEIARVCPRFGLGALGDARTLLVAT